MLINRKVVRSKMVLKGMTVKELCDILDMTDVSFYNKINGKREFTESEIFKLISLFGNSIFFDYVCLEIPNKKGGKRSDD